MNIENIKVVAQLIESMEEVAKELEHAITRNKVEKGKKAKEEILELQKKIKEML